jgi:Ca2+/H+ antiporter
MSDFDLMMMRMELAMDPVIGAVMFGLIVGIGLAVIVGAARLGFKFAGWIIAAAILVYFWNF